MKIRKQFHKQKNKEFEFNLSFQDWPEHILIEPTSKELDEMKKEVRKNQSQNNPYYHPLQGA